jgi:alkylation response protein AidB-like acyl-CoA dehydrogenase
MNFKDTPEESVFRQEVRGFIESNLPRGYGTPDYAERLAEASYEGGAGLQGEEREFMQRWRKAMAERRWIAPHWPKEYGGAGLSTIEQFIYNEEMAQSRAPAGLGGSGVSMIGPILILYGNEEQKKQFLPRIAAGEMNWCQGYSEPGAGSDLASLQTRAVRDGDDFIINGQKIWTSGAHRADWIFMLTRTNPDAPKHRGISMFLVDMKSPGITVSPLINLAGDHGFNQVFFDNVRVPARQMVGEENRGWYLGATLLDFERSNIGSSIGLRNTVNDIVQFAKENRGESTVRLFDNDAIRYELAERLVEADIARLFSYRIITMQKEGKVPNYEASMNKAFRSETQQRVARTGMKIIGLYGNLARNSKWAPLRGRLAHSYMTSVSATIAAGTSEIQRNVIAQRGLGLPRD